MKMTINFSADCSIASRNEYRAAKEVFCGLRGAFDNVCSTTDYTLECNAYGYDASFFVNVVGSCEIDSDNKYDALEEVKNTIITGFNANCYVTDYNSIECYVLE